MVLQIACQHQKLPGRYMHKAHIHLIPHAARLHCSLDTRPFLPFQKGLESRPQAMWEEESGPRTRLQLELLWYILGRPTIHCYNCSVKKM